MCRLLGEPGLGAHPNASRVVSKKNVAGNQRGVFRDPVDDLGAARGAEGLDPAREPPPGLNASVTTPDRRVTAARAEVGAHTRAPYRSTSDAALRVCQKIVTRMCTC